LIEIAEAETVGAIDDDGVGVRYIEAAFDDRRREQNIGFGVDELGHDFLEVVAVHLAVAHDDAGVRQERAQLLRHVLDGHYPIVQKKDLSTAIELAANGIADDALVILRDDRFHRQAIVRRSLYGAHVARTGERQVERAWNRRGAEREDVHELSEHFEFFLVQNAEALLLV